MCVVKAPSSSPSSCGHPESPAPPTSQMMQQAPASSHQEVCDCLDEDSVDEPCSSPPSPSPAPSPSSNTKAINTSPPVDTNTTQSRTATTQSQLVQKVAFPTTIPSHPSTIQYIPIVPNTTASPNTTGLRATLHFVQNESTASTSSTTTDETPARTIQYQLIQTDKQNTIHYQPGNLQLVPTSIIVSNAQTLTKNVTELTKSSSLLHFISTNSQPTIRILSRPSTITSEASTKAPATSNTLSSVSDQHIRVLTPSEIMSTLPISLGQESFESSLVRTHYLACVDSLSLYFNWNDLIIYCSLSLSYSNFNPYFDFCIFLLFF